MPANLKVVSRRVATLRRYANLGAEQARQANSRIFGLENTLKAFNGEYSGLRDPRIMAKKTADEKTLRDQIAKKPEWQAAYGSAWTTVQRAQEVRRRQYKTERFGQLRGSSLAPLGLLFVQYAAETAKPDGARLDGFHDAQLPTLKFQLSSPAPYYPALEEALLADALQESLEELGPTDPFIKAALGGKAPKDVAAALIRGTKLGDQAVRKQPARRRRTGDQHVTGSRDRPRPRARPARPRGADDARSRRDQRLVRGTRENRPGAIRRVRHRRVSRRDVHAAALYTASRERLSDERHESAIQDDLRRPVRDQVGRLRQPAAVQARAPGFVHEARARWTCPRR